MRDLRCWRGQRLYAGNSFEILPGLRSNSIDLVLSDPPYGTTALAWDTKIDVNEFWRQINRIAKPTAVIALFAAQPFATDLINANRRFFRYELIWEKVMPVGFLDANRRPLRAHENILIFAHQFKGSSYNAQMTEGAKPYRSTNHCSAHYGRHGDGHVTVNKGTRHPRSVLKFAHDRPSLHPTQKPLDLVRWLVRSYSKPGDRILDPFAGSLTTLCACRLEKRRGIAIELGQDYIDRGMARLQAL